MITENWHWLELLAVGGCIAWFARYAVAPAIGALGSSVIRTAYATRGR